MSNSVIGFRHAQSPEEQAQPPAATVMSMQQALNRALDEVLAENANAVIFGEDCGRLGGVFRITDGLQAKYGEARVFDTPLAESGILGMSVGLAMAGFHPIPEVQFDGFAYPAVNQIVNQIVCQIARMNYRSRGTLPMPITLRVPSFGGIRAPEHHGESLEALFTHVPGLKVVSPSNPHEAYHLLKYAASRPDPVIFMEPKSRYWQKGEVNVANADAGGGSPTGAKVMREGRHLTLVAWGAMVARCLQVAELAAEDGVDIEVLDLRWLKPIDTHALVTSVAKTRRAVVVHEAPLTSGLGAEVAQLITQGCFNTLKAPVERVTGFDVPYPSGDLEDEYIPNVDRSLTGSSEYWSTAVAEISFPLPDLGEGLIEATVLEWLVSPGDQVERNQPLVEVETSKSAVELPSPQAGKVVRTFGGAGDRINVGEPLIVFEVPDNTAGIVGTVPKDEAPTRRVRLSAVLDED